MGWQGGRAVHKGGTAGVGSGEGPSAGAAPRHRVRIHNHHASQDVEVDVPEDRCGGRCVLEDYLYCLRASAPALWLLGSWATGATCLGAAWSTAGSTWDVCRCKLLLHINAVSSQRGLQLRVVQNSRISSPQNSSHGRYVVGRTPFANPRVCVHRYILWEAEEHGLLLPYACRMGCCTACAVRIKEGDMYQPQVGA